MKVLGSLIPTERSYRWDLMAEMGPVPIRGLGSVEDTRAYRLQEVLNLRLRFSSNGCSIELPMHDTHPGSCGFAAALTALRLP